MWAVTDMSKEMRSKMKVFKNTYKNVQPFTTSIEENNLAKVNSITAQGWLECWIISYTNWIGFLNRLESSVSND